MTLTETRPEEVAPAPEVARAPSPGGWLTSADHKRVGLLYLFFALLFLLLGGVLGGILQAELASNGVQLVGDNYARIFSMHASVSTLLFLAPAWVGLATYLVPLQIGAARLAFPRLQAFTLWLYAVGGGLLVTSYLVGPPQGKEQGGLGLSSALPSLALKGGTGTATDLWITSLILVALASLLAAGGLATTILKFRTPGLTFPRLPAFTWATFVSSVVIVMATPVFLAGLVLLYLDNRYGGTFFDPGSGPAITVWQHTVWLLGRPEVFLLALPALGAACDIVSTHAHRTLLDTRGAQALLGLFGLLSLGAWLTPHNAANALVLPNPAALQVALGAVAGALVLMWLGTLAMGKPKAHVSLLFVAGFVVLAAFGAANGIIAAIATVHGHAWTEGHLHAVFFGAPTVLLLGALYHWAPKLFGRALSAANGGAVFLLTFGGFLLLGLGDYLLGYNGAPAHVKDFPAGENWTTYSQLSTVGAVLVILGVLLFVADVARAVAGRNQSGQTPDDPYQGLTLEWATTSPPPPQNFDAVPEVRSATPLADLRAAAVASNGAGR
jgi:heme/copper-type cytochrome/quinol oxidase subunit 1